MNQYDVYHQWLGIPPEEQPPSFYKLLGLAEFEHDPEVIRNAAERQALHVRRLARGEFTDIGQELLNEVAQAKLWLISPEKREEYDRSLREREGCRETIEDVTPSSVEATYIKLETTPDGKLSKDRWIIGYHADCDFRIDWKTVSGIHCQLTLHGGHLHVSDLNSTNGTFINRVRIQDRAEIRTIDLLTLGRDHRVILPRDLLVDSDDGKYVLFVGRGKGNEIQVDSPSVSLFHAKMIVDQDSVMIEDMGSKTGTSWIGNGGEPEPIKHRVLDAADIIRLGEVDFSAVDLMKLAREHRPIG
jgi:pSer/pThr/pTyr-binding forkhead associated (FHA) protein